VAKTAAAARLVDLDRQIEAARRQALMVKVPLEKTLREAWDEATDDWRRDLLSLLIKRIVVHPGITKPYYKQWRFDPMLVDIEWIG